MSSWGGVEEGPSSVQQGTNHWGFLGDEVEAGPTPGSSGSSEAFGEGSKQQGGRRLGNSMNASSSSRIINIGESAVPPPGVAAARAALNRNASVPQQGTTCGMDDPRDLRAFEHQDGLTEMSEAAVRRLEEESDGEPMAVSG